MVGVKSVDPRTSPHSPRGGRRSTFHGVDSEADMQFRAIWIYLVFYVVSAVRSHEDAGEGCIDNLTALLQIKTQQPKGYMTANAWCA